MSPRAACRLDTLGFTEVYDYMPGKVDWLAHNLPVEGERPDAPIAGRVMRDDVVLCRPTDRIADVRESIERSPYPFALITTDDRTLLGRAPSSALDPASDRPVSDVAEPGPKTFRPHVSAEKVAGVLADKGLRWAIVTTPEGRVLGVASREDLARAATPSNATLASCRGASAAKLAPQPIHKRTVPSILCRRSLRAPPRRTPGTMTGHSRAVRAVLAHGTQRPIDLAPGNL